MSEPMYPHLLDTDKVRNMGYNGRFFVWQHIDGRVCQSSTNTAAERQFELHGVMASTPTKTKIDAAWLCHMCGIQQPAWAGDCLTCETLPMMGDRE